MDATQTIRKRKQSEWYMTATCLVKQTEISADIADGEIGTRLSEEMKAAGASAILDEIRSALDNQQAEKKKVEWIVKRDDEGYAFCCQNSSKMIRKHEGGCS